MAVNTELLELLRQLINDEAAAVLTDDELEQILDRCDEDINRAAAWCSLIRANKVAEDVPGTMPSWPVLPDPPAAPTLPTEPTWPTLPDPPAEIDAALASGVDYTGLTTSRDATGGNATISQLQANYRDKADLHLRVWERERDDLIKKYEQERLVWAQKRSDLLAQYRNEIDIWVRKCQNAISEFTEKSGNERSNASVRVDRARAWQDQAREWGE